ncbi:MAG TPA: hypothetical protein VGA73_01865, partial [Candidatus Binatia bacterium]
MRGAARISSKLARARIYADPASPYLRLLKIAGCEFSDLQAGVLAQGLEATLTRLAGEGVYLTADEFKGKKDVVRAGRAFRVSPGAFQHPSPLPGLMIQTSGTGDQPMRSTASLGRLGFHVPAMAVFFAAHDLFGSSHAMHDAALPASGGTSNLLIYARLGIATERWFTRPAPAKNPFGAAYHYLTTRLIVGLGNLYGPGFPRPEFRDPKDIVLWIEAQKARGKNCCVTTPASNAGRIARTALG